MNGKSQATIIGGCIATLILWILDAYVLPQVVPSGVEAAITTLVCAVASVWMPPSADPAGKTLRFLRLQKSTGKLKAARKHK